jgi:hypothetical protein
LDLITAKELSPSKQILRTFKMTKEEFNENLYNTANDWNQFLKSDDYYKIK